MLTFAKLLCLALAVICLLTGSVSADYDPWTTAIVHQDVLCWPQLWHSIMPRITAQQRCDQDVLCLGLSWYKLNGGDGRSVESGWYQGCGGTGKSGSNHWDIIVKPAPTSSPTNAPTSSPTNAPTNAPTSTPTKAPTNAPTPSPTNAPTNAPTSTPTKAPTNAPTSAPTKGAQEDDTDEDGSGDDGSGDDGCDLSRDGGDIAATVLDSFNVLDGNAVVIIERELEWGQDQPELVTDVAGCADQFTWTSEESLVECEYETWTGSISVTNMLKSCKYSKDESSPDTTVVTIDFAIREERDIDLYMGSIKKDVDFVTIKNSIFPLSLKFKTKIDVTSGFSVTRVMYDVTTTTVTLFTPATDADEDLLKAAIETHFGVPSAATELKVTTTGFVYEAPGDLKTKCDALNLGGFPMDTPVCTVKKEFLIVAEVQERSVVVVTLDEALIPTAKVSVYTLAPFPFELSNPSFVSASQIAGLTYGDIGVTYEDGNDFCPPDALCPKIFNFEVTDNSDKNSSPICTFSGEYQIEFKVKCVDTYTSIDGAQAPLDCPLDGTETITITLDMESYNHCPDAFVPVELELKSPSGLVSYRGSDVAGTTSAFLNTQTLRFYADVLSNNAELEEARFIFISVENVNKNDAPVILYDSGGPTVAGAEFSLNATAVVGGTTDPTDETSFLRPTFDFVADTDNSALLVALTETAVFKVSGTIEVAFKFEGQRRRMLLQTGVEGETLTASRTVVLGGDRPDSASNMLVLEQSAAHDSVSVGFMLALLSVYTVFALHI